MRLLLDTCTFLWLIAETARLSAHARELLADPGNEVHLSVVSTWEIALKYSLGRLVLSEPPQRLISAQRKAHGIESMALEEDAVLQLERLPRLHADPFDRMLICQAILHGSAILTPDPLISQYPVRVLW